MNRKMKNRLIIYASVSIALASFFPGCSGSGDTYEGDTDIDVVFESVAQSGGASGTTDSTALLLTFDIDPTSLSADDISVAGATKGELTGSGTTRSLAISDITVDDGASLTVTISGPTGYAILGSPKTAVVYRAPPHVGMIFQGGRIAYFLQPGDPGYVLGETHGLIASMADLSTAIPWSNGSDIETGATGTAVGTGQANTTTIVAGQGAGSYAAQLCDSYTNADTGTGIYSDWCLPSKDELAILYVNRDAIGGFTTDFYWSSTEHSSTEAELYYFMGSSGYGGKSFSNHVRAVRYF